MPHVKVRFWPVSVLCDGHISTQLGRSTRCHQTAASKLQQPSAWSEPAVPSGRSANCCAEAIQELAVKTDRLLIRWSLIRIQYGLPKDLCLHGQENQTLTRNRGALFRLSYVLRHQKLAFAGNLPERNNPDQANSTFRMGIWMAHISQRGACWRAEVRKRGHKPIDPTFDAKQQAREWAQRRSGNFPQYLC